MAKREIWKAIPGCRGYEVSNFGRVKSLDRYIPYSGCTGKGYRLWKGRILSPREGSLRSPYKTVYVGRKGNERIHTLVMQTFIGPRPKGMQVCHNNRNKFDNRLENLRYDTPRNNILDRELHGTDNKGERHGMSKLTAKDVRNIRETIWRTANDLAIKHRVSIGCIKNILTGRNWEWL